MQKLVGIREKVKLVAASEFSDKVKIGSVVTIRDEAIGENKTFKVGSYMIFANDGGRTISYNSPLARIIMGAKIDEIKSGKIGKNIATLKAVRIEI